VVGQVHSWKLSGVVISLSFAFSASRRLKFSYKSILPCTAIPSTPVSMLELSPPLPVLLVLRIGALSRLNTRALRCMRHNRILFMYKRGAARGNIIFASGFDFDGFYTRLYMNLVSCIVHCGNIHRGWINVCTAYTNDHLRILVLLKALHFNKDLTQSSGQNRRRLHN
jgi:hypothetical protein